MKASYEIDEMGTVAGTGQVSVELNGDRGVEACGKRDSHGCLLVDDEIDSWMTNKDYNSSFDVLIPDEWEIEYE